MGIGSENGGPLSPRYNGRLGLSFGHGLWRKSDPSRAGMGRDVEQVYMVRLKQKPAFPAKRKVGFISYCFRIFLNRRRPWSNDRAALLPRI
ncbi:hypothetical protein D1872_284730 [compost metagenome]